VSKDTSTPVPLSMLEAGTKGHLSDTSLDPDTRSLLRSLGLTDLSPLRVCKSGEPCIIQVRTTRIGLSNTVANKIYVVVDSAVLPNGSHGLDSSNA
jgi:Fe2+ transport system protein FeoA